MQKLLRRTPSGSILCSAAVGSSNAPTIISSFSLPFTTTTSCLSLGFKKKTRAYLTHLPPPQPSMPSYATAFHVHPSSKTSISSRIFPTNNCCRICRCKIDSPESSRVWVVQKETRAGSRSAWFHTASNKGLPASSSSSSSSSSAAADGTDDLDRSEEKPQRLHRRQKGSGSAVGEGVNGNPDLSTIPGVGPRNLRKLVGKGIAGVADLKQLYKDKVCVPSCGVL